MKNGFKTIQWAKLHQNSIFQMRGDVNIRIILKITEKGNNITLNLT